MVSLTNVRDPNVKLYAEFEQNELSSDYVDLIIFNRYISNGPNLIIGETYLLSFIPVPEITTPVDPYVPESPIAESITHNSNGSRNLDINSQTVKDFYIALSANITTLTFSNLINGSRGTIYFDMISGIRTVAKPSGITIKGDSDVVIGSNLYMVSGSVTVMTYHYVNTIMYVFISKNGLVTL